MREQPVIIGIGRTRFGEHYEVDPEDLIDEAGLMALDSAGIERKDLDACYISDYLLQVTNKIGLEEGFMSQLLEMNIPIEKMRSFSSALSNACNAIEAGKYDIVLVGGMEKMTDRLSKIRDNLMLLVDHWSYYAGGTPEANHELLLREYAKKYNIHGDDWQKLMTTLAHISVKNHRNAVLNEYAHFRREIDVKRVFAARAEERKILGLYDFAPISDGATALILASPRKAREYTNDPIYVLASSLATDFISYPSRPYRAGFIASKIAMDKALKMAKISLEDIKILEVYDQSTVLEMVSLEDMGFVGRGTSWIKLYKNFEDFKGFYDLDGKQVYVNTDGGLKADGNPLGATGGAQIFEVVKQLKGEAGQRQIKPDGDLLYGCVQEIEGFGTKVYVHILGREKGGQ
jgi:acetyl-CoA C-acetyltransferase